MSSIHVHSERSARDTTDRLQRAVDAVLALLDQHDDIGSYLVSSDRLREAIENALEES
jgi:hypothetical protein